MNEKKSIEQLEQENKKLKAELKEAKAPNILYGNWLASMDETFEKMKKLGELDPEFLEKLKSLNHL